MNIVIVGHVDHGKSTIIGRLLADTRSLPEGKLEEVKERCRRNSKPFEYAFLIDALKDEQAQGITIDAARVFFKTARRPYIIIDAPGHIEFLKNMVTGATRAQAALLVIDAKEGVQENSRRHGYMLSMLGMRQVAVLVNKMDLVGYRQDVFDRVAATYADFLSRVGIRAACFIPVSGREGDMVAVRTENLAWYRGRTVLEVLDEFTPETDLEDKPLRLPVQDVYKFTNFGDDRRIVAGTVTSGTLAAGDDIIFYPSGKKGRVQTIEKFMSPACDKVSYGEAVGITLSEQIYVKRGEVIVKEAEPRHPLRALRFEVNLFWLGKEPLTAGKKYLLKIGTDKVPVHLESVERLIDAAELREDDASAGRIKRYEVADCILQAERAVAFDRVDDFAATSRFVIVDDYEICGGGTIRQALHDPQEKIREQVFERRYKWIKSHVGPEERQARLGQKARLIVVTGEKDSRRKEVARALEQELFKRGKFVYFLGIGSVIHGVDADIENDAIHHPEHLRRLAEVAHIMLDAGMILIVCASALKKEDIDILSCVVDPDLLTVVWVGKGRGEGFTVDYQIREDTSVGALIEKLQLGA